MSRFTVFDTEDNSAELLKAGKSGFEKTVTCIAAMTDDGYEFFDNSPYCIPRFLEWIDSVDTGPIYAHNLQYDLGNLFGDELDAINVKMMPGSSRLLSATWKNKRFYNSLNIWPMSAKKLGDAFGLKKLDMDVHSKDYVMRDCEIIVAAMRYVWDMVQEYGVGKVPATIGGLAMRIWQTMSDNWFDDSEFSRQAYYGGRVELFAHEMSDVYYTDVNSIYPRALTELFPTELMPRNDIDGFGIAEVTIKVPDCDIAPLPWRDDEMRNYYPVGTFRGTYTFAEIQNAIAHGATIKKLHQAYGSKGGFPYYRQFIEHFYGLRLRCKSGAENLFYKLLMNNLYGQLAMSGGLTVSRNLTDKDFDKQGNYISEGVAYGCKHIVDQQFPLREFCNCSHAAYVTSYARIRLHRFLTSVPAENLLYCDTDSMIFKWSDSKPLPFPISKDLGEMKLEYKAPYAITYAPKAYTVKTPMDETGKRKDSIWKAKGVRGDRAKEFLTNGEVTFAQPFKLREAVSFFDRGNSKKLSVWRNITKQSRKAYDRKEWDEQQKRYFPPKKR